MVLAAEEALGPGERTGDPDVLDRPMHQSLEDFAFDVLAAGHSPMIGHGRGRGVPLSGSPPAQPGTVGKSLSSQWRIARVASTSAWL